MLSLKPRQRQPLRRRSVNRVNRAFRVLAFLVVGVGVTACGITGGSPTCGTVGEADVPTVYELREGDKLKITVFGEPDLSGEYEVDADGQLTFPLIGEIRATGRPVSQLRAAIAEPLNARFLRDAKVSVEVVNYSPFYVLGEVRRPGAYDYEPDITVRNAVALAGGFTRRAVTTCVDLVRVTPEGETTLEVGLEAKVLPRDTIEVRRRLF